MKTGITWPQSLYHDVFGEDISIPESWESDVEYVLDTLTDRERDFIIMRYKNGFTLKAAGQSIDVGTERSRQIINKALRKLRHESRALVLMHGKENCNRAKEESREKAKNSYLLGIEKRYGKESPEYAAAQNARLYKISDFNLSVRTYNCLRRAGYQYLDELLPYDDDKLAKIRNFGTISRQELKTLMISLEMIDEVPMDNKKPVSKRLQWPQSILAKIFSDGDLGNVQFQDKNIEDAVASLPDLYKNFIYLHYKENLTVEEAAHQSGLARATALSYESKALSLLRANPRKAIILYGKESLEKLLNEKYKKDNWNRKDLKEVKLYPIAESGLSHKSKSRLLNLGYLFLNEMVPLRTRFLWKKQHVGRNVLRELEELILSSDVVSCDGAFDIFKPQPSAEYRMAAVQQPPDIRNLMLELDKVY